MFDDQPEFWEDSIFFPTINQEENSSSNECLSCSGMFPEDEFPVTRRTVRKDGSIVVFRKNTCRKCVKTQTKVSNYLKKLHKKPDKIECPICLKTITKSKHICLDHDHKTGEFRGWICNSCNSSLGRFRDDIETFKRIIDYLSKNELQRGS